MNNKHGQRRRARLVHEDQGAGRGVRQDAAHAAHVPRERGQALLQALAVAHVREHGVKPRQNRLLCTARLPSTAAFTCTTHFSLVACCRLWLGVCQAA